MKLKQIITTSLITAASIAFTFAGPFYFEDSFVASDSKENCFYPTGISSSAKQKNAVFFWQETDGNSIYISSKSSSDGIFWNTNKRFAGPFEFSGDVPQIYSAATNEKTTVLAVMNEEKIELFTSQDSFASRKLLPVT